MYAFSDDGEDGDDDPDEAVDGDEPWAMDDDAEEEADCDGDGDGDGDDGDDDELGDGAEQLRGAAGGGGGGRWSSPRAGWSASSASAPRRAPYSAATVELRASGARIGVGGADGVGLARTASGWPAVPGSTDTRTLKQLVTAASANDVTAMRTLAVFYRFNGSSADRRIWLQRAASFGDAHDIFEHAYFLYYTVDKLEAGKLEFQKSAALGHVGAVGELDTIR
jgi:hypothetical protein